VKINIKLSISPGLPRRPKGDSSQRLTEAIHFQNKILFNAELALLKKKEG